MREILDSIPLINYYLYMDMRNRILPGVDGPQYAR